MGSPRLRWSLVGAMAAAEETTRRRVKRGLEEISKPYPVSRADPEGARELARASRRRSALALKEALAEPRWRQARTIGPPSHLAHLLCVQSPSPFIYAPSEQCPFLTSSQPWEQRINIVISKYRSLKLIRSSSCEGCTPDGPSPLYSLFPL